MRTLDLAVIEHAGSDDLDRVMGSTVSTRHLHVHLRDSSAEGHISVLLVHVDGIGAGEVTENDAVVSDGAGLLLEDLARGDDFALNLTNLVLSLHVIPELGPGEDSVSVEDSHSVKLWVRVLLGWQSSSDDEELSQLNQQNRPNKLSRDLELNCEDWRAWTTRRFARAGAIYLHSSS